MTTAVLLAIIVLAGTSGDLSVSRAMKGVGSQEDLTHPSHWGRVLGRAFRQPWLWAGIAFMTLSFFTFLALLSREDISFAIPATALSYVVGALGSRFLLGERVSVKRWIGVILVGTGVALASLG
jgi:drug/metabolite transporter (DMT)-like permease